MSRCACVFSRPLPFSEPQFSHLYVGPICHLDQVTILVPGPPAQGVLLRPRCPWPPGGGRDQPCHLANVATWWWVLGEHEQLDVELRQEKLENQEASGNLGGESGTEVVSRGRMAPSSQS